jgi:hypothetical protein
VWLRGSFFFDLAIPNSPDDRIRFVRTLFAQSCRLAFLCITLVCSASFAAEYQQRKWLQAGKTNARLVYDQGAITRGDPATKKLALVFTGDEFADGANSIRQTLKARGVQSSFFFTGRFYRNANFRSAIRQLKRDGHYCISFRVLSRNSWIVDLAA